MLLYNKGSEHTEIDSESLQVAIYEILDKIGERNNILIIPPDFTRFHSRAGEITCLVYKYFGNKVKAILPALGTHVPMTQNEINQMFPGIPHNIFIEHNWRSHVLTIGTVPAQYVSEISEGNVNFDIPVQINQLIVNGNFDLILSIGQVVPHEVIGMANYNKNIFIGCGGSEIINKSHFLGAAFGMERIMGRANTAVRKVLNYASEHFTAHLPIVYIQTVLSKSTNGVLQTRGIYAGSNVDCFNNAAQLSIEINFKLLEKPLKKVVCYLPANEYKSTWLGNKAIYRTRMAIETGGELIILAPGVKEFGEDAEIDRLIRKYGYKTTPEILSFCEKNEDLRNNLSAAAHLIHGSTENRFKVTYCTGNLTKLEVEGVNYNYANYNEMVKTYNPDTLTDGFNTIKGEEIYFISNPALGLWAVKERFEK